MMQGWLLNAGGERLDLPPFLSYDLKRTGSVPCDSFEGTCPCDGPADPRLEEACRLIVEEDGARRFTGVLDEYRLSWDERGGVLTLSGRGLAALLLDNESPGQDYQVATLDDVLRDHVTPYGIRTARAGSLPAVPGFSVGSGSSLWQVWESFARYHGGVEPRFDVWGDLTVDPAAAGSLGRIDGRGGVISAVLRDRRYGVYSEILVQDRGRLTPQRVVNEAFAAQGGSCRTVITMPGKSAYQAMRYSGEYQLSRSAAERFRLELTLAGSGFCEPGDRVAVSLEKPSLSGEWTVLETRTTLDSGGERTRLTLGRE